MAVDIIYETHSTTLDNEEGRATGWLPGELSELGRAQARELGARHAADKLAVVFTSDLRRAVETAELAFGGTGVPVLRDPRLRECDYGELNGMPVARLAAERARHIDEPFPGGQSYRQVVAATRAFLCDLAAEWDDSRVLLIAHSANRWALDYLLQGCELRALVDAPFDWQPGWRYRLPTGWRSND